MKTSLKSRWTILGACSVIVLLSIALTVISYGANVNLIAYVTYSILDGQGQPLPDGSIVMIFGSTDDVNDGPVPWLGGPDLIADSTQGDDVFLGWVRIGEPAYFGSNGTFYTANQITFDDSVISFLYLRFFDSSGYPIDGEVVWGTSPVFGFTSEFGQVTVDFVGNYMATMTNNFVIIPEPSTAHLMLLFLGVVAGMHASFRKSKNAQHSAGSEPDGPAGKKGPMQSLS